MYVYDEMTMLKDVNNKCDVCCIPFSRGVVKV